MGARIVAHPVLVYNVGYNVQLAVLLPVIDDHNPANLDVPLERHCCGGSLLPSDCKVPKDPAAAYCKNCMSELNEFRLHTPLRTPCSHSHRHVMRASHIASLYHPHIISWGALTDITLRSTHTLPRSRNCYNLYKRASERTNVRRHSSAWSMRNAGMAGRRLARERTISF